MPIDNAPKRIPELDGLRGLAILMVLMCHYYAATVRPDPGSLTWYLQASLRLSWSGVDLFFVLSGFLIGGILLDNREAANYFKVFYVRRICRIFPIYYLTLLLFFAVPALGWGSISPWLYDKPLPFLSYATFTQNISAVYFLVYFGFPPFGAYGLGVTWSLAVEEQFYLMIPYAIKNCVDRALPYLLVGVIILAPIFRIFCYYYIPAWHVANYVFMPARADGLMLGVLTAYLLRRPSVFNAIISHRRALYAATGVLGSGMVVLTMWRWSAETGTVSLIGLTWIDLFYTCLLIIVLTTQESLLARICRGRILRWLGEISYGVYLIHIQLLGLLHGIVFGTAPKWTNLGEAFVTCAALLITLLIATASWRWFERPIVRKGRSLGYNSYPKVAEVSVT